MAHKVTARLQKVNGGFPAFIKLSQENWNSFRNRISGTTCSIVYTLSQNLTPLARYPVKSWCTCERYADKHHNDARFSIPVFMLHQPSNYDVCTSITASLHCSQNTTFTTASLFTSFIRSWEGISCLQKSVFVFKYSATRNSAQLIRFPIFHHSSFTISTA